jgi:hypothetical protein
VAGPPRSPVSWNAGHFLKLGRLNGDWVRVAGLGIASPFTLLAHTLIEPPMRSTALVQWAASW